MSYVHAEVGRNTKIAAENSRNDYMNKEDAFTLKAVVLYILKNCSDYVRRNVYYIVKTAFVAQQKHLAKYLCPLYEDKIAALQFGPVPSNLYDALKIARGDANTMYFHNNDNLHLVYDSILFQDETFYSDEDPDMNYLSASAVECIDEALKVVSAMSFEEIINTTHSEEWARVFKDPNTRFMDYLAIAKEGGADETSLSYIKDNLELDELLKS